MTREPGQSQASADALRAYMAASDVTSAARWTVTRLERELRAARKALKEAQSAEKAADAAYLATPYTDA